MPRAAYYQAHREELAEKERSRYQANRVELAARERLRYRRLVAERGPRKRPARRPAPPVAAPSPLVEFERCELVDQAIDLLRPYERAELGSDFDSIARDLVGEYVVAALAGEDPVAALVAERARYRHDRAALVFGTSLADGLER